jgi:ubiquinone/menaquinone biosynthesis C-methylase UbiE
MVTFAPAGSGYFESHWKDNELADIPLAKREEARRFLHPLISSSAASNIKTCLDVGTGDGVHLSELREAAPHVERAGLDISGPGLVSASRQAPGSLLMLADAETIPLLDASVDATFSYGVLGYLANPWQGLSEMVRVTKPGGLIGVWFYPDAGGIGSVCFRLTRSIVTRLPGFFQKRLADLIVPLLGLLPTASGVSLRNAPWAACREVVLVNIAAPSLMFPTLAEVVARFEALECHVELVDERRPITVWARRPDRGAQV